MRNVIRASMLALALCVTAYAGDIPNPPAAPPSPPQQQTAPGEILTPPLVEIALALLALL